MYRLKTDENTYFSSEQPLPDKAVLLKMLEDEKERIATNTTYGVERSLTRQHEGLVDKIEEIAQKHRAGEQWISGMVETEPQNVKLYFLFSDAYWAKVDAEVAALIETLTVS
jgi:hypothetical protein